MDWYDNWYILSMFITHACDNFPEVEKTRCFGLKIMSSWTRLIISLFFYYIRKFPLLQILFVSWYAREKIWSSNLDRGQHH